MMPDCPGAMTVNSNNYRTYSCDGEGNFGNPVDINFLSAHALWDENQRELRMSFIDIYFMLRYWYPEGRMKQDQSENLDGTKKPKRCKGKKDEVREMCNVVGAIESSPNHTVVFFFRVYMFDDNFITHFILCNFINSLAGIHLPEPQPNASNIWLNIQFLSEI